MTKEAYILIRNASMLSTLLALIVFFIFLKGQPRQNRILSISLFVSGVFDLIGWILVKWFDPWLTATSNNLYLIIAFPTIMLFYHEMLVKRSLKNLVRIITLVFLAIALISIFYHGLNVPNTYSMTLSSVLIMIVSLFFVADLNLMDPGDFAKNPFHQTNILLNTSLSVYYFTTIIIFAVTDYVHANTTIADARYVWASHNLMHVLKNVGLAVAFYLSAKRINVLMRKDVRF
jgi:hypothetical protein